MPTRRRAGPRSLWLCSSRSPIKAIQATAPSNTGSRKATYPNSCSSTSAAMAPYLPPMLWIGATRLPVRDQPGSVAE